MRTEKKHRRQGNREKGIEGEDTEESGKACISHGSIENRTESCVFLQPSSLRKKQNERPSAFETDHTDSIGVGSNL